MCVNMYVWHLHNCSQWTGKKMWLVVKMLKAVIAFSNVSLKHQGKTLVQELVIIEKRESDSSIFGISNGFLIMTRIISSH